MEISLNLCPVGIQENQVTCRTCFLLKSDRVNLMNQFLNPQIDRTIKETFMNLFSVSERVPGAGHAAEEPDLLDAGRTVFRTCSGNFPKTRNYIKIKRHISIFRNKSKLKDIFQQ